MFSSSCYSVSSCWHYSGYWSRPLLHCPWPVVVYKNHTIYLARVYRPLSWEQHLSSELAHIDNLPHHYLTPTTTQLDPWEQTQWIQGKPSWWHHCLCHCIITHCILVKKIIVIYIRLCLLSLFGFITASRDMPIFPHFLPRINEVVFKSHSRGEIATMKKVLIRTFFTHRMSWREYKEQLSCHQWAHSEEAMAMWFHLSFLQ